MKRTIEIEDTLQDCVDRAIDAVKDELLSHLEQNPDTDETPDLGNDLDYSGAIHEIIDGAVPIHTSEIDTAFYLYGSEIEEAFEDAGFGSKDDKGWPCGWKAAAIYCYIEQGVHKWYRANAEDVFQEWKDARVDPPSTTTCSTCGRDFPDTDMVPCPIEGEECPSCRQLRVERECTCAVGNDPSLLHASDCPLTREA